MPSGPDAQDVFGGISDPASYIVRTGIEVLRKERPKAPSKRQAAALEAAGFTRGAGPGRVLGAMYVTPEGKRITADAARQIARALPEAAPAPRPTVTGEQLLEELLKRRTVTPKGPGGKIPGLPPTVPEFEELLKRPRTPTPDVPKVPAAGAGRVVGVLGRVLGTVGAILYPTPTASDDVLYPPGTAVPPQPDRGRPVPPPEDRPLVLPEPTGPSEQPEPLPQSIPDRTGPPRETWPEVPAQWPIVLLPLPREPQSQSRPQPTTGRVPTAGYAGQTLPNLSFPLPSPQLRPAPLPGFGMLPFSPPGAIVPTTRNPLIDRPLTLPQASPLTSLASGCPPCPSSSRSTRPKRKRKPREICYRGEYVETSRGTTKFRKRKIKCR